MQQQQQTINENFTHVTNYQDETHCTDALARGIAKLYKLRQERIRVIKAVDLAEELGSALEESQALERLEKRLTPSSEARV
jgi:uncharacterized protein YdeI (YjbR/CyaY-like superfamily)